MNDKYVVTLYAKKKKYKRLDVLLFIFYVFFINFIIKYRKFEAKPSDYEYLRQLELKRTEVKNAEKLKEKSVSFFDKNLLNDDNDDNDDEEQETLKNALKLEKNIHAEKIEALSESKENNNNNNIELEDDFQNVPIIIGKINLIYILFSTEFVFLLIFILCHIILFLFSQWNLKTYLFVAFNNVDSKNRRIFLYNLRKRSTHVYIKPVLRKGTSSYKNKPVKGSKVGVYGGKERYNTDINCYTPKADLVELKKENNDIYFYFKQKKYLFNYDTLEFESLTHFDNFPVSFYLNWKGLIEANSERMFEEKEVSEYCEELRKELKIEKTENILNKMNLLYSDRWMQMINKNHKLNEMEGLTKRTNKRHYHKKEKVGIKNGEISKEIIKVNLENTEKNINNFYIKRKYFELPYDIFVDRNLMKYGENVYNIPVPCFKKLLYEAILSPFFIFQFFSIILWVLDSYWYFGVFSIFVLVVLESQLIVKRIKDFNLINDMKVPAHNVYVYRNLKWKIILSSGLLPGDIYIVENSIKNNTNICTCETLLIHGMCITDESILTGESVPLIKAAIEQEDNDEATFKKNDTLLSEEKIDIKNKHKKNVIFAGTKILLTKNENSEFDNKKMPIQGCIGIVLKNGFTTYQGKLVRTIINSSEKVNSSSFDSLVFLFILLFFSLCSSAYVIHTVIYSHHERNLYKVLLSVSHVITSVIPPEFPITLSLAVTISVVYLYNQKIYCTEPFRLPFSGKAHICAFDKTGTLTENDMTVLGLFGLDDNVEEIAEIKESIIMKQKLPFLSVAVIASCHSLCTIDGKLLGDPLEKNSFSTLNCILNNLDCSSINTAIAVREELMSKNSFSKGKDVKTEQNIKKNVMDKFHIYKRFFFTSELQRMTCVVLHEGYGGDWYGEQYTYAEKSKISDTDMINSINGNEKNRGVFKRQYLVVSKGSPEMMKSFLKTVPNDYDEILQKLTIKGYRVLCLAANVLNEKIISRNIKRDTIEKDLIFCGFLAFVCPIKNSTLTYMEDIQRAGLKNIMITGDNALTACQVAQDVNMIPSVEKKDILILKLISNNVEASDKIKKTDTLQLLNSLKKKKPNFKKEIDQMIEIAKKNVKDIIPLCFFNREGEKIIPFVGNEEYIQLCNDIFILCITGDVIEYLIQKSYMQEEMVPIFDELIKSVKIFCRVSPKNKEVIIKTLNKNGNVTVMCGDGTNDMAALKAAHVGISLLSLKVFSKDGDDRNSNYVRENSFLKKNNFFLNPEDGKYVMNDIKKLLNNRNIDELSESEKKILKNRLQQMVLYRKEKEKFEKLLQSADDSMPLVKLGEASIASPFTYKGSDIQCVKEIISCGRCALSKVIMMYKLMIINSLITAFSVSILILDGVKLSDVQTTVISLIYTALVVLISKATPLKNMSNYCPPNSLFNISVMLSLVLQVVVHFSVLIYGWKLAASFRSADYIPDTKGDFSPNLVNTCIYYLIYIINLSIFSCNYEGLPFMIPLHKHNEIMFIFISNIVLVFVQIMEIFPFLNNFFSLVSFPSVKMKLLFLSLATIDMVLPYLLASLVREMRLYIFKKFNVYI